MAKFTFFVAEALRGVTGLVFDALRNRFVNELERRDYVTEEMWRNKLPFCAWHCKHYTRRAVMKFYESDAALAQDMGVSVSKNGEIDRSLVSFSLKIAKDLAGGPFPAYLSGNVSRRRFMQDRFWESWS